MLLSFRAIDLYRDRKSSTRQDSIYYPIEIQLVQDERCMKIATIHWPHTRHWALTHRVQDPATETRPDCLTLRQLTFQIWTWSQATQRKWRWHLLQGVCWIQMSVRNWSNLNCTLPPNHTQRNRENIGIEASINNPSQSTTVAHKLEPEGPLPDDMVLR